MKRSICLAVLLIAAVLLTGCGSDSNAKSVGGNGSANVQDVLEQQINDAATEAPAATEVPTQEPTNVPEATVVPVQTTQVPAPIETNAASNAAKGEYDVDLTAMSSTMVYSEVYYMMSAPESYMGERVRMNGKFVIYQAVDGAGNAVPGVMYFACIIADATSCCSQGLEFQLAGEHAFPKDYPEVGSNITVSGIFDRYEENGYWYCYLRDAVIE